MSFLNRPEGPDVLMGIEKRIDGASQFTMGCKCAQQYQQWIRANNFVKSTKCQRCSAEWHYCPLHQNIVAGFGLNVKETDCTCGRQTTPVGKQSACPFCKSMRFLIPNEASSTRLCGECRNAYHLCPIDGNAIKGPGLIKLSTFEQGRCQCHEDLPFLGKQWASPFS